jgi:hypothetical protein
MIVKYWRETWIPDLRCTVTAKRYNGRLFWFIGNWQIIFSVFWFITEKFVMRVQKRGSGLRNGNSVTNIAQKGGTTDRFNREKRVVEAGFRKSCINPFNRNAATPEISAPCGFRQKSEGNDKEDNSSDTLLPVSHPICAPLAGRHCLPSPQPNPKTVAKALWCATPVPLPWILNLTKFPWQDTDPWQV